MSGEEDCPTKCEEEEDVDAEVEKFEEDDLEEGKEEEQIDYEEEIFKEESVIKKKHKKRKIYFEDEEGEHGGEEEDEEYFEEEWTSSEEELSESDYEEIEAIAFEWEDETYEFVELVKPKRWGNIFVEKREKPAAKEERQLTDKMRYLQAVDSIHVAPVKRFYESLDEQEYYGINPKGMKAICKALQRNTTVQSLSLKDNKLTEEACYHLGALLITNKTLSHLDLTGCRIGAEGIEALVDSLSESETLKNLNLSKCYIGDEGMKILATGIKFNNSLQALNLSYNNLAKEGAEALGSCFAYNTSIHDLDLNYNDMFDLGGLRAFFKGIMESEGVTKLVLSWNGLEGEEVGKIITAFFKKRKTISYFDLSANRLDRLAINEMLPGLQSAEILEVLKLGKNPISQDSLESLLESLSAMKRLQILDLEDLWVKKSFIQILDKIKETREIEVVIGGVLSNYEIKGPDYQKILLNRAQYEAMKPKASKAKKDFGHLLWSLGDEPMNKEEFMERVKRFKAKISSGIFPELLKEFQISKTVVDVKAMRDKYLTLYPNSQPPPDKKKKDVIREQESGEEGALEGEDFGEFEILTAEDEEARAEDEEPEGEDDENEPGQEEFFLEKNEQIKIEDETTESTVKQSMSTKSMPEEKDFLTVPTEIVEPPELKDQTEDDA